MIAKKIIYTVLSGILIVCCLCSCYSPWEIREMRKEEYNSGYEDGYDFGYDFGHDEGYYDGHDDAVYDSIDELDARYDEGYSDGYDDGESDGYYSGATYTCLYFGDVDRAFQCAVNGVVWYTFLDAYDEYISNIFDNEETRSELFWALIGATLSGDVSEDEKDLLISTFGEDLFTRNGISLS